MSLYTIVTSTGRLKVAAPFVPVKVRVTVFVTEPLVTVQTAVAVSVFSAEATVNLAVAPSYSQRVEATFLTGADIVLPHHAVFSVL